MRCPRPNVTESKRIGTSACLTCRRCGALPGGGDRDHPRSPDEGGSARRGRDPVHHLLPPPCAVRANRQLVPQLLHGSLPHLRGGSAWTTAPAKATATGCRSSTHSSSSSSRTQVGRPAPRLDEPHRGDGHRPPVAPPRGRLGILLARPLHRSRRRHPRRHETSVRSPSTPAMPRPSRVADRHPRVRRTAAGDKPYRLQSSSPSDERPAGPTMSYWPHFTLRPSLIRTRAIDSIRSFEPLALRARAPSATPSGQSDGLLRSGRRPPPGRLTWSRGLPSAERLRADQRRGTPPMLALHPAPTRPRHRGPQPRSQTDRGALRGHARRTTSTELSRSFNGERRRRTSCRSRRARASLPRQRLRPPTGHRRLRSHPHAGVALARRRGGRSSADPRG